MPTVKLPDGKPFEFWDDKTRYGNIYHVAQRHPKASDENPGTKDKPFKTISRAAEILEPGQKAIVHKGVYRERVAPARGGTGPDRMIAYEAAAGEKVIIKGSRVWEAPLRPSEGHSFWRKPPGVKIWMGDLPAEWFGAYNPFLVRNMCMQYRGYEYIWTSEETRRFLLRRGAIFADGAPLRQVFHYNQLAESDGAFWVEDPGLRIHLRLPGDADPGKVELEATVQEQVFAPHERYLGYIRVSGFRMEHAADGIPVPQRSLLSTTRGHHWIIEGNAIRLANASGLDIGKQDWSAPTSPLTGRHVVRGNAISDCGICGICGAGDVTGSLVEDNVIERIGGLDIERIYENAGLKFHCAQDVLIRRNVFRHLTDACGLWLDVLNKNCRITGNVFADIETVLGAAYIECSHDPNLVDNNIFWDIRFAPGQARDGRHFVLAEGYEGQFQESPGGTGFASDASDYVVLAHNFFGRIKDAFAACVHLSQSWRLIAGRVGRCRRNKVLNNVFYDCPQRILLGTSDNASDGNLYDERNASGSLVIVNPPPRVKSNLKGWREFEGLDMHSSEARIEADFDPDGLVLTLKVEGDLPAVQKVDAMHARQICPGPFGEAQWKACLSGKKARQKFPVQKEAQDA